MWFLLLIEAAIWSTVRLFFKSIGIFPVSIFNNPLILNREF